MKERKVIRWEYHEKTVVLGLEERPKTLFQKILHCFGVLILWLFGCLLPLSAIITGILCIQSRHVPAWRLRREMYGDQALGYGLLNIALGVWGLGYMCRHATGKRIFGVLGWLLAIVAATMGVWYEFLKH